MDTVSNKKLRLLSIGAHPADVFDQCAGTMAHHAKRGDYIACLSLTHGARVHDKVISNEMQNASSIPEGAELLRLIAERTDVKAEEIRAAGKILGFEDIFYLGVDDAILMVTAETVRAVARIIRQIKPDVILTHFPREGDGLTNPHAVSGQIVMHALQFANAVDPGDRNPPHRIAQMFFFGEGAAYLPRDVFDARRAHYNEVFIDITDVIEKKLAAMDCLVSQGYAGKYARKRLEVSDGAFGGGYSYGEGFIKLRAENHYYLPVPEMMLETAKLSDHDLMDRYSWRLPIE
jgi:LmbE family N-acetylglucosaminyl deacetylase